jgi:hypothetical protein
VLIVQENRTFNNFFATFPGATGTTIGEENVNGITQTINLTETPLANTKNLRHSYPGFLKAYDGGKMDGFNLVGSPGTGRPEKSAPYEYVNPSDIAPYWSLAETYSLANPEPHRQSAVYQSGVGMRFASGKQDGYHHDVASTKAPRRALSLHGELPVERGQLRNVEGFVRWRVAGHLLEILYTGDRQRGRDLERV